MRKVGVQRSRKRASEVDFQVHKHEENIEGVGSEEENAEKSSIGNV